MKGQKEYIVICQQAWMNESGFGVDYNWDRERFSTRQKAIKHGWKVRGSDDFNIAEISDDDFLWFGWMDQKINEDAETMTEIAEAIGLYFSRAALEASKP